MSKALSNEKALKLRTSTWLIVASLFNLLLVMTFILLVGWDGWQIISIFLSEHVAIFGWIVLLSTLPLLAFLVASLLFLLITVLGSLFGTYVKVHDWGLEYRVWPFYLIRCKWEDIERRVLYFSFGPIRYEVLRIRNLETIDSSFMTKFRKLLGAKPISTIPLSEMRGYPKGEYADALKKMIPQVMAHAEGDLKPS